jgi:nickel/cobalt exporter
LELLIAIPAAVGLGALHFLEPGHGKGVMTAYLISSRARMRDAILLAFTAALSHTITILFLAFIATSALQFLNSEQVEAWLGLLSGAVITLIGVRLVRQQLFPPVVSLGSIRRMDSMSDTYVCSHGHLHFVDEPAHIRDHLHGHDSQQRYAVARSGHGYHHHHRHSQHLHEGGCDGPEFHAEELPLLDASGDGTATRSVIARSKQSLFSLGVLAGLIPCPSSLVMLLTAVSAGHVAYGVGLVAAFSLGGALALSLLGILLLKAEHTVRALERRRFSDLMGTLSAMIIVLIGFLVTYESLMKTGLFA